MAYALRYYKEIPQKNGGAFRLEIHKKDSSAGAIEIGAVVQGLSLQIQGQQGDIDTPIVKTSLSMTFADASDLQNGKKNGFWEEFYTPDAVLWKVILKAKDAKETAFRTIWGGYVTPDSFSETLSYRGSVNIIARDNIGHMQDFPFDAEGDADGLISLYDLVETAWAKIESPMVLDWRGEEDEAIWMQTENNVVAYSTLMNVSAFGGMNWYEAVEKALYSYGVVMRYVGGNKVQLGSLRYMPYFGRASMDNLPVVQPVFVAGAQRELVPAVKRIEESVDYDLEDEIQPLVKTDDFSGDVYETPMGGFTAPVWALKNTTMRGWSNTTPSEAMYFNASAYRVEEIPFLPEYEISRDEIHNAMWLLCDGKTARAEYTRCVNPIDLSIGLRFGQVISLYGGIPSSEELYIVNTPLKVLAVKYAVSVMNNGITSYLNANGGWSTSFQELEIRNEDGDIRSVDILVPLSEFGVNMPLTLTITRIETSGKGLEESYIQVQSLTIGITDTKAYCKTNSVNTNYQDGNNVILSRDPELAPALNTPALPAFIKNGIFYRQGDNILPAKKWKWSGGSLQQMAVFNHLQLLSYFAKPNNLISGTIVNADITRLAAIYKWQGAEHILVSGNINILTGHIDSAMLREFARYENMWSEVAGADLPDTEQDSRSNVEGGASGSGASSTYSSTTNVNIGTGGGGGTGASNLNDLNDVDTSGVVAQSVLYYNGTKWVDMSMASLLSGYAKTNDLGTLAYKNGLTASDVGALSTAGGTITGASGALTIARTDADQIGILFKGKSGNLGYLGFSSAATPAYINTSGTPYALIHSGNIGSYAVGLDGSNARATRLTSYENLDNYKYGFYSYVNGSNPTNSFGDNTALFAFTSIRGNDTWQIAFDGNGIINTAGPRFGIRGNFAGKGWTSWYRIAFTDSNVASATKLATARTIWGQSFDGTGNVSGNLTLGTGAIISSKSGTDRVFVDFGSAGDPYIGYGTASAGIDSNLCGNNVYFRYGTSRTTGLILNSSGNVTIGSADTAASISGCKLFVGGDTYVGGKFTLKGKSGVSSDYVITNQEANGLHLYVAGNTGTFFAGNGNVLIGTTTDSGFTLDVNGPMAVGTEGDSSIHFRRTGYNRFICTKSNGGAFAWRVNGSSTDAMILAANGNLNLTYGLSVAGAVTMASTLNVGGATTINGQITSAHSLVFNGDYGIWKGNRFTGSLTENDIAYNATTHVFYGNLIVKGDITA